MLNTAFIFVDFADRATLSPFARVGGVPLLIRTLKTLARAGVTTSYVVSRAATAAQGERLTRLCATADGAAHRVRLLSEEPGSDGTSAQLDAPATGSFAVVRPDLLFEPGVAMDMAHAGQQAGARVGLRWDTRGWALVVLPAAAFSSLCASLVAGVSPLADEGGISTPRGFAPRGRFVHRLTDAARLDQAEAALLKSLENPRDGYTDTWLYRHLSRPLSRRLAATGLRPNDVTLSFFGVGLLGAWCFTYAGYWSGVLGSLLLLAAVVLDNVDGEIARLKFQESAFGEWLDISCGTVLYLAAFTGVGVGAWRNGRLDELGLVIAALGLGIVCTFPLVTWAERAPRGSPRTRAEGWADAGIRGMLKVLTSHDFVGLFFVSAVCGVLDWFVWGAAIGIHVFWISLAVLLARAGRRPPVGALVSLLKPPAS